MYVIQYIRRQWKVPCTPYNSVFCGVQFQKGDISNSFKPTMFRDLLKYHLNILSQFDLQPKIFWYCQYRVIIFDIYIWYVLSLFHVTAEIVTLRWPLWPHVQQISGSFNKLAKNITLSFSLYFYFIKMSMDNLYSWEVWREDSMYRKLGHEIV